MPTALPDTGALARFYRLVPAVDSLRRYSFAALRSDIVAGLTVATVAVPQGMAYALVAGVPVEHGLYTAIVMTAVGALFDSSRQLINGPTNAISIAVLSAVAVVPPENRIQATVLLAFLVGSIQVAITLARLGDLTRYISHSVILGFTLGAGALLVLDQLRNLLGLTSMGDVHDPFLLRFWLTMTGGGPIHLPTLAMGLGAIALVLLLRVFKSRVGWKLLPAHPVETNIEEAYGLDPYLTELIVASPSTLNGKTLGESQLRSEMRVHVLEILRGSESIWSPSSQETLRAGDVLRCKAPLESIMQACERCGLELAPEMHWHEDSLRVRPTRLVEALVTTGSILVGRTVREMDVRGRYSVSVLAIKRREQIQVTDLRNVRLKPHDTLLLQGTREDFRRLQQDAADLVHGRADGHFGRLQVHRAAGVLLLAQQPCEQPVYFLADLLLDERCEVF